MSALAAQRDEAVLPGGEQVFVLSILALHPYFRLWLTHGKRLSNEQSKTLSPVPTQDGVATRMTQDVPDVTKTMEEVPKTAGDELKTPNDEPKTTQDGKNDVGSNIVTAMQSNTEDSGKNVDDEYVDLTISLSDGN